MVATRDRQMWQRFMDLPMADSSHCTTHMQHGRGATIAGMTMWLPNLDGRRGPVYRAIADAIDESVQDGTLRAGARLPPHRDLADHLGVTVTTITRAYTEAARRGLTTGHVGRGTFIRGSEVERASE